MVNYLKEALDTFAKQHNEEKFSLAAGHLINVNSRKNLMKKGLDLPQHHGKVTMCVREPVLRYTQQSPSLPQELGNLMRMNGRNFKMKYQAGQGF